jgi:predicted transcriptional regulator
VTDAPTRREPDEPGSIREAAEVVDRDYGQGHRNRSELADIGVVEFEACGPGRAKEQTLADEGLEIDIPVAGSDEAVDIAAP